MDARQPCVHKLKIDQLIGGEDTYTGDFGIIYEKGELVVADFFQTIKHPLGRKKYFRPVVEPEDGKVRVIANNISYEACKRANINEILCDVLLKPEEEELFANIMSPGAITPDDEKSIVNFVFIDHPMDKSMQASVNSPHVQFYLPSTVRLDRTYTPDCIIYQDEVHDAHTNMRHFTELVSQIYDKSFKIRSIGGLKFTQHLE